MTRTAQRHRSPRRTRVTFIAATAAIVGWAGIAVLVFWSTVDPEGFPDWSESPARILGPGARVLTRAADARVTLSIAELRRDDRPIAERFRSYRERLHEAERLLVRSLRAQPRQPEALAMLAAVRYELSPPTSRQAREQLLELAREAATTAPTRPEVHQRVGELIVRMGDRTNGLGSLARAIELDPERAEPIAEWLLRNGVFSNEAHDAFPKTAQVVAALESLYHDENRLDDWARIAETHLDRPTVVLLTRYGNALLGSGAPDRLIDRLTPRAYDDIRLESERLRQCARAWLALGEPDSAIADATAAATIDADNYVRLIDLGDVLYRTGHHEEAIRAYTDALHRAARDRARERQRARLYAKIGRAEEDLGRPDRALEFYDRALALDPGQPVAERGRQRLSKAAGRIPGD